VALLVERGETLLGDTERVVVVGDVGNKTLAGDVGELAGDDSVEAKEDVDSRRRGSDEAAELIECGRLEQEEVLRVCLVGAGDSGLGREGRVSLGGEDDEVREDIWIRSWNGLLFQDLGGTINIILYSSYGYNCTWKTACLRLSLSNNYGLCGLCVSFSAFSGAAFSTDRTKLLIQARSGGRGMSQI